MKARGDAIPHFTQQWHHQQSMNGEIKMCEIDVLLYRSISILGISCTDNFLYSSSMESLKSKTLVFQFISVSIDWQIIIVGKLAHENLICSVVLCRLLSFLTLNFSRCMHVYTKIIILIKLSEGWDLDELRGCSQNMCMPHFWHESTSVFTRPTLMMKYCNHCLLYENWKNLKFPSTVSHQHNTEEDFSSPSPKQVYRVNWECEL